MPKLQIEATELVGTDVNFVSLVKRGANRIPFRITKEDTETMLDLSKIGRQLFSKADPAPALIAVICSKSTDLDVVREALGNAGLTPEFVQSETDVSVTFAKADGTKRQDSDVSVVKFNDDISFVVTDLKKTFSSYNMQSTSFAENIKTGSYYPSVSMAASSLVDTVYNIMYEAESPKDASGTIAKAVDEFKDYLKTMTSALPTQAFKADMELSKAMGKKKPMDDMDEMDDKDNAKAKMKKANSGTGDGFEEGKGTGTDPKATADDAKNSVTGKQPAQKEGEGSDVEKSMPSDGKGKGFAAAPADSNRADDADNTDTAGVTNKNKKLKKDEEGDDVMAAIAALTKTFSDGLASMNNRVDQAVQAMKSDVEKISGQVSNVAEMARKTDEAVNGTVLGDAGNDKTGFRKSDVSKAPPLLDTALDRRDRRNAA
jgi:hypothetical protein